jgi:hypothetical protein
MSPLAFVLNRGLKSRSAIADDASPSIARHTTITEAARLIVCLLLWTCSQKATSGAERIILMG